jgi:tRNA U34 2-thiouridine synthase MnmA/TrmU
MSFYNAEGDTQCNFSGSANKITLTVGKNESNGYLDFIANRKTRNFNSSEIETNCKTIEVEANSERYVLKFDGLAYRIPMPIQASLD